MPQAWYSTCALSNAGARLGYSRQVAAVSSPSCPSQAPQPSGAVVRSSPARRHAPHPPPGQRALCPASSSTCSPPTRSPCHPSYCLRSNAALFSGLSNEQLHAPDSGRPAHAPCSCGTLWLPRSLPDPHFLGTKRASFSKLLPEREPLLLPLVSCYF